MQITNTLLFTALFITATIPIIGSEKTEDATILKPMQYPQIGGKGPGMGHDYQKNTPGPEKGKPNYHGGQNGHTEIESLTTNRINEGNQGKTSVSTKIATDIHGTLLHAAAFGDETSVNALLKQGANPNARAKDTKARTALILAAAGGHLRIVNSLIANGAKVDEKDRTGHTALNWAAMRSRNEVASLLLKNGADINTKNNIDVSPLLYAIGTHNNELVKILLNQGADIEVISRKNKMTPLLLAIELKDSKTLKLLLDKDVKVSSKNSENVKKILSELEK